MDIVFGILSSACLTYLVGEINSLQKEMKELKEAVIWVQAKLDRRTQHETRGQDKS